ncbi:ETHYLENE INSENSITIVE 3-like 1 protein [Carex littledalei]|uniref:ETHYLENE INSENSITIVE 3-like 1 protein n=1 Tax=Carex littledalei TaxID=544730 RepID=A0A833VNY2_9POAL|nr:ETHYLENE INSENSITIVE 3-like 1 protein [Carex littledalei]
MRSTSNTSDNLLTPPVHAKDQSEADLSRPRHLIRQAQLSLMTTDQSDAGSLDSRQVMIREPQIQDNNIGSPLSSLPKRQLTREELQKKINKYTTRLRKYARHGTYNTKGKQKARINSTLQARKKLASRMQHSILEQMLMIMEQCNAKGFVYGMVTETSKSITGASDSLREWWKTQAMFDKTGLAQIDLYNRDNSLNLNVPQDSETRSTTELMKELSDPTLGSILSLLMQHCDPPQRKFPFIKGVSPPWWPTTQEDWWGQTGISRDEGLPPFTKPHDIKKKWKVAVIVGIIKSMSPDFSRPYNLVQQSHHLRARMNAKESKFWTLALVAEAKKYCQEHPDMSVDDATAFLQAYGNSSSSQIAPSIDKQNVSISGNEAPRFGNPFGVMHWPPFALPGNTTSAWPITVSPMGQPYQSVRVSSTGPGPDQQMTMSGSFAPQFSPWAFSYGPILSANVPLNVQQNHGIGISGASNGGFQEHHTNSIPYVPLVEQPGEAPSTSGTRYVLNQMHEYGSNMEFGFEPSSGNQNSTTWR